MNTETITLPRTLVAALVDLKTQPYIDGEMGYCNYCGRPFLGFPQTTPDLKEHTTDCPVRIVQEALRTHAEQQTQLETIVAWFQEQEITKETLAELRTRLTDVGLEKYVPDTIAHTLHKHSQTS